MKTAFFDTRSWSSEKLKNTGDMLYYGGLAGLLIAVPLALIDFGLSALIAMTALLVPLIAMNYGGTMQKEGSSLLTQLKSAVY